MPGAAAAAAAYARFARFVAPRAVPIIALLPAFEDYDARLAAAPAAAADGGGDAAAAAAAGLQQRFEKARGRRFRSMGDLATALGLGDDDGGRAALVMAYIVHLKSRSLPLSDAEKASLDGAHGFSDEIQDRYQRHRHAQSDRERAISHSVCI